jgi:hypothetical protein
VLVLCAVCAGMMGLGISSCDRAKLGVRATGKARYLKTSVQYLPRYLPNAAVGTYSPDASKWTKSISAVIDTFLQNHTQLAYTLAYPQPMLYFGGISFIYETFLVVNCSGSMSFSMRNY